MEKEKWKERGKVTTRKLWNWPGENSLWSWRKGSKHLHTEVDPRYWRCRVCCPWEKFWRQCEVKLTLWYLELRIDCNGARRPSLADSPPPSAEPRRIWGSTCQAATSKNRASITGVYPAKWNISWLLLIQLLQDHLQIRRKKALEEELTPGSRHIPSTAYSVQAYHEKTDKREPHNVTGTVQRSWKAKLAEELFKKNIPNKRLASVHKMLTKLLKW